MRYVTRTIKMAVIEYEYLKKGTKEVMVNTFTCRQDKENKMKKALIRKLEGENCIFVSIVSIQTKDYHYEMDEEQYIAEARLVSVINC